MSSHPSCNAAYAAPLVALYRRELEDRSAFLRRRLQQQAASNGCGRQGGQSEEAVAAAIEGRLRRVRAWVDADPWAPADLLLPALLGLCTACLR